MSNPKPKQNKNKKIAFAMTLARQLDFPGNQLRLRRCYGIEPQDYPSEQSVSIQEFEEDMKKSHA